MGKNHQQPLVISKANAEASMDGKLQDLQLQVYLKTHRKIQLFNILQEVWTQIQTPSEYYIVLNKNAPWSLKIHAIFKDGMAIYHENQKANPNPSVRA